MARICMSLIQTHKRQSKIQIKLAIAKCDEGLRITIISKTLGNKAMKLRVKCTEMENSGEFMSGEFLRLMRALNFYSGDIPNLTINQIPNMKFINSQDIINEGTIENVFVDDEIKEWIELFGIYVKLMKKYMKRFDLI